MAATHGGSASADGPTRPAYMVHITIGDGDVAICGTHCRPGALADDTPVDCIVCADLNAGGFGHYLPDLADIVPAVSRGALARHGVRTLLDAANRSRAELLRFHGVGAMTVDRLDEALEERGLTFANERQEA